MTSEVRDAPADAWLQRGALGLLVVQLVLLLALWLLPMPDADAVPGHAPRLVVGA